MKKYFLISISILILFAACGKKDQISQTDKKDELKGDLAGTKLVIATVNNPDMVVMKEHTKYFTEKTGIEVQYVIMPENELRQKVTQDVALGAGNFDIVTIGAYEAPFWAANGWIESLEPFFAKMTAEETQEYDRNDIFAAIQSALSSQEGELHALPFYAEGSIVFYRKDLFAEAGLTMPKEPSWEQIYGFAQALHKPDQYGIVLRGLPGWGQNMAVFGSMINAFGARWYDLDWNPQFDTPEMRAAWEFYKKIIKEAGEPGATSVGFTEALALMSSGKAAIWYDASSAAGPLKRGDSQVKDKIAYALAPTDKKKNTTWFWTWSLGIESASKNKEAAFQFLTWATSKEYIQLIGTSKGWAAVPPGTRTSTYENPQYQQAAEFSQITYDSIANADYDQSAVEPVPYKGIQYISIPEFQGLGEKVAQELAAYLADTKSLDASLAASQAAAQEVAQSGGYQK